MIRSAERCCRRPMPPRKPRVIVVTVTERQQARRNAYETSSHWRDGCCCLFDRLRERAPQRTAASAGNVPPAGNDLVAGGAEATDVSHQRRPAVEAALVAGWRSRRGRP